MPQDAASASAHLAFSVAVWARHQRRNGHLRDRKRSHHGPLHRQQFKSFPLDFAPAGKARPRRWRQRSRLHPGLEQARTRIHAVRTKSRVWFKRHWCGDWCRPRGWRETNDSKRAELCSGLPPSPPIFDALKASNPHLRLSYASSLSTTSVRPHPTARRRGGLMMWGTDGRSRRRPSPLRSTSCCWPELEPRAVKLGRPVCRGRCLVHSLPNRCSLRVPQAHRG